MLIRTQDKVPSIYVDESRDYQVLCRAYDIPFNGVKYDVDSMLSILSASKIRNNMLSLLQSKLGFFTNKNIDDLSLRYILGAFMTAVKHKGSLTAVRQIINIWLKTLHLETNVSVNIFNAEGGTLGDVEINPYTIAIGTESSPRDYSLLKELLSYVVPAGYELYFYFYSTLKTTEDTPQRLNTEVIDNIVLVSDDINSIVRSDLNDSQSYQDALSGESLSIEDIEDNTIGHIFTTVNSVETLGSNTDDVTRIDFNKELNEDA